jgi:hypothetical protein
MKKNLQHFICIHCDEVIPLSRLSTAEREVLKKRERKLHCPACGVPFQARLAIPQKHKY